MRAATGVNPTFMDIGGVVGPTVLISIYYSFSPQVSLIVGLAITIVNFALTLDQD